MRSLLSLFAAILFAIAAAPAQAAHTQAQLVLADETAAPGTNVLAGVRLRMDPGWHVYWKNSGASGIPTAIKWDLPPGIAAGEIQWPLPEKLPPDDLTTYIYQDEVVLVVPLKLAPGLAPGPREIKATVSWLECKEQCVPGKSDVRATLNVGPATSPSADAKLIRTWQDRVPLPGGAEAAAAWWGGPPTVDLRPLILEWASSTAASEADFYPFGSEQFEVQGATERLPSDAGKIRLRKMVKKYEGDWPKEISGVLVQKSGDKQIAHQVLLGISSIPKPAATVASGLSNRATEIPTVHVASPLWLMVLYALIGGLILNVMPCVLPVIALKILGFVGEARNDPRRVRRLGVMYTLGVLVSFLALASIVIAVKAAGHRAGWGMQFSSPRFVVVLTVLVTLVALNLFGLFEVNLSGRVLDQAGGLASGHGNTGAFFNGVLATLLATPCTAPFLGAALGFAFSQKAPIIVLMFLAVGLGLALPYALLSWQPAWLKFLPKPGPWMEKFKVAMGFPMLATAVWLFSLTSSYYGKRTLWLGIFLVIVAFAAWFFGQFIQRGRTRRGLALVLVLVLLVGGFAYAIEGQLDWREPVRESASAAPVKEGPNGIEWQRWSARAVAHAQEEGQPVLVDFTADWCLTCQANKRIAIEVPSVRSKLKQVGAVAFLGDYTRFPDDISRELNRYGRAGVPLVLVYPGKAGAPPEVLPELLTPGIVLDALNRAVKQGA